tara:strand:+ start:1340 stop:2518 length:1179 start_codon:yes stop_codon:yes gene_type:complete
MRAISLANKFIKNGHKVTLITSSFFHQRKQFRSNKSKKIKVNKYLDIILIKSPGYKKHIGLKRILDHILLGFNLNNFLKKNPKFRPDKIFLGYPPIETSLIMVLWAKKLKIPVMIDVKDNWPINFIEPFPKRLKPLIRFSIFPYFFISKYVFKNSQVINSISEEFINWIKDFSNNPKSRYTITPLVREPIKISKSETKKVIEFWNKKNINLVSSKNFTFVGSLTNSFDFDFIFKSAEFLRRKYPEYNFVICGSGDQFYDLLKKSLVFENIHVIGEISKYEAMILIKNSIATIAPYKNSINFQNSIPNKIIESLENGTPFITNLDGKLKEMIKIYKNGIHIPKLNYKHLSTFINLIEDNTFKNKLSNNAARSYENLFNFHKAYDKLKEEILNM